MTDNNRIPLKKWMLATPIPLALLLAMLFAAFDVFLARIPIYESAVTSASASDIVLTMRQGNAGDPNARASATLRPGSPFVELTVTNKSDKEVKIGYDRWHDGVNRMFRFSAKTLDNGPVPLTRYGQSLTRQVMSTGPVEREVVNLDIRPKQSTTIPIDVGKILGLSKRGTYIVTATLVAAAPDQSTRKWSSNPARVTLVDARAGSAP